MTTCSSVPASSPARSTRSANLPRSDETCTASTIQSPRAQAREPPQEPLLLPVREDLRRRAGRRLPDAGTRARAPGLGDPSGSLHPEPPHTAAAGTAARPAGGRARAGRARRRRGPPVPPDALDPLRRGLVSACLTGDYLVTYHLWRGRRPRLQGIGGRDAPPPARPALRAGRPRAHRARVGAGDDALRCDEASARAGGRGPRRGAPAGPGEAALSQSRPDPADPRPVDRQVHGAPGLGARRPQDRVGGDCMSTMTAQATQVYSVFIRATPEQVWDAITKPEFTQKYFYGSAVETTAEPGTPWRGWSADRTQQLVDGEVL